MPDFPFGRYRTTERTARRGQRETFAPSYELTDEIHADLRAIERADENLRGHELDAVAARRLLEDALTRNAYGTASIEGNPLTLTDVESLLARGPTPDAAVRPEEREILNYAAYMQKLPERSLPHTPDDVLALHGVLFAGVLDDAGSFKDRPNFIGRRETGEVVFVPAAPERVAPELANALKWFDEDDAPPLVRSMLFFHEFQSIHPFLDGNGRTGRALATLQLFHHGYPGVRYALMDYEFNRDRDAYYAALAQADASDDKTHWVAYMADVLRRTFEGAVERFLFRDALPTELNDRQREVAEWFGRLNHEAPRRQVKFNDVHVAFPQIAERTLKRDLARLRDAGVLEMEGRRKAASYRLAPDLVPSARP